MGAGNLLPRMTERKREEVLGGVRPFRRGILNPRFDGEPLRRESYM